MKSGAVNGFVVVGVLDVLTEVLDGVERELVVLPVFGLVPVLCFGFAFVFVLRVGDMIGR